MVKKTNLILEWSRLQASFIAEKNTFFLLFFPLLVLDAE